MGESSVQIPLYDWHVAKDPQGTEAAVKRRQLDWLVAHLATHGIKPPRRLHDGEPRELSMH